MSLSIPMFFFEETTNSVFVVPCNCGEVFPPTPGKNERDIKRASAKNIFATPDFGYVV